MSDNILVCKTVLENVSISSLEVTVSAGCFTPNCMHSSSFASGSHHTGVCMSRTEELV